MQNEPAHEALDAYGHVEVDDGNVRSLVHADGPPVGAEELDTCPSLSVVTHNDWLEHATAVVLVVFVSERDQPAWARRRSTFASRYPAESTAAQKDSDGQDTDGSTSSGEVSFP